MTGKFPFVLVLLLLMSVSLSTPLLAQERVSAGWTTPFSGR